MVNSTLISEGNISISDDHIGLDVTSQDYYDNIDNDAENKTSNITIFSDWCEVCGVEIEEINNGTIFRRSRICLFLTLGCACI